MKGIEFVVDEQGKKKAVILDLQEYKEVWEDVYDTLKTMERRDEPRETFEEVRKKVLG